MWFAHHQQIHEEYSDKIKDYYEWELNTRIATLQACEPYAVSYTHLRLDRPVSGLVVFAKTSKALPRLNEMFRNGEVKKT